MPLKMNLALKMDPEIRAQWTAALRATPGDRQGRGALKNRDGLPDVLGVLCELAIKADVIPEPWPDSDLNGVGAWYFAGNTADLPPEVVEWADLEDNDPRVTLFSPDGRVGAASLSSLGDELRWSFARLADAIDGGASR